MSSPSSKLVGPLTCISSLTSHSFQEKHQKHFAHGTGPGTHLEGPRHPGREFAGVCEARPGIIESTHIAPLDDNLSKGLEQPKLFRFSGADIFRRGERNTWIENA